MTVRDVEKGGRFVCRCYRAGSTLGYVLEDLEAHEHRTRSIVTSATDGDQAQRRVLELLAAGANARLDGGATHTTRRLGPTSVGMKVTIELEGEDARDLALIAHGAGITPGEKARQYVVERIGEVLKAALGNGPTSRSESRSARRPQSKRGGRSGDKSGQGSAAAGKAPSDLCGHILQAVEAGGPAGVSKETLRSLLPGVTDHRITYAMGKLIASGKCRREGAAHTVRYFASPAEWS